MDVASAHFILKDERRGANETEHFGDDAMVPPEDPPKLINDLIELRCIELWERIRKCPHIQRAVGLKYGWQRHDWIESAISVAGYTVLKMMREGRVVCLKEYLLTGHLNDQDWFRLIKFAKTVAVRAAGHQLKQEQRRHAEPLEHHAELTNGVPKEYRNEYTESLGIRFFSLAYRILKTAKQKLKSEDRRAFLNRLNGWEFAEIAAHFRTRTGRKDRNRASRSVHRSIACLGSELGRQLPIEFLQRYCSRNKLSIQLVDSTGEILLENAEKVGERILSELVHHFNICRRVHLLLRNPIEPQINGENI